MDPATMALIASLGMQGGKMLFDMFKQKPGSPTDAAKPWLDKAAGLYGPYQQQGQDAYGKLNPLFSQMTQDPGAYLESLMKGYEPSKGFQMKKDEMLKAAGNTAAAGGMRGSLGDRKSEAGIADMLMGQDMQQWLQNVVGLQDRGTQGLNNFYEKGYDATNNLGNIYGNQGNLAMLSEMFKQQQAQGGQNDMWKGLSGIGGALGGFDWSKLLGKGSTDNSNMFMPSTMPDRWTQGFRGS